MKKRFLCILVATALLLGILAGCGNGSTGASDPDKPGVGSTESDKGGHADDDSVAVMKERVKAVNSAINYECVGLEETVKEGLLFYNLTDSITDFVPSPDREYNPDKPLDYYMSFSMRKAHTEGIVSEDTYVALLKNEYKRGEVVASDVIETDDLYVYYHSYLSAYLSTLSDDTGWSGPTGDCYILVKGTDIVYSFSVQESWTKPNYFECSFSYSSGLLPPIPELAYAGDDAEYIFTDEFWQAFAQTVKFVGNADEDFEESGGTGISIDTQRDRGNEVEIPYVEGWYVGETWSQDEIRRSFERFIEDFIVNVEDTGKGYGFLVIDDFGQGEPTMFFDNGLYSGLYKYASNGEVTLIHDFSDIDDEWMAMSTDAGRTCLLFSAGSYLNDSLKVVDLKTFEITDRVSADYDFDEAGNPIFLGGTINGVPVDEETAQAARMDWESTCNIHLLGRGAVEKLDFNAAWREYEDRG